MWADRFRGHLAERLSSRPEIAKVSEVGGSSSGEQPDLRVEAVDGTVFVLRVVRSSPGGEDFTESETTVTKDRLAASGKG